MLLRALRNWSALRTPRPRNARQLSSFYSPSIDALEERRLMTATVAGSDTPALVAWPLAGVSSVVGRNVFYNNSRFDGNDPRATAADDYAIATDKSALLPGQTAKFGNYTSFRGGINDQCLTARRIDIAVGL